MKPDTTDTDDRETVRMTMRFEQTVTVEMPMHEPPATPEAALDAWWAIGPGDGIEVLRGDTKRNWECVDIEVDDTAE